MKGYRNSSIREQEGIYYLRIKEDNYYDVGHTYGKMLVNVEHPVLNFLRNWFVVYILSILMKLFSKRINEINQRII
jgi:hypothetical protein